MERFEDLIRKMEENMNRMFAELWETSIPTPLLSGESSINRYKGGSTLLPGIRRPFVDIIETDKEITAIAEMPGLKKEDIGINITNDRLEVSADIKKEEEKKGEGYIYRERRRGGYYRSIPLPSQVDPDNSKASYNNGILEVKMPKTEITKKTEIKVE